MSVNQTSLVLPFIELVQFLVHVFISANKGQTGISPRQLMITMGSPCDRWPRLFFLRLDGDFALKFNATIIWSVLVGTLTSVTRHCCPMLEVNTIGSSRSGFFWAKIGLCLSRPTRCKRCQDIQQRQGVCVCVCVFIYPVLSRRIWRIQLLKLSLEIYFTFVPFHERSLCLVGAYVMLLVFGPGVETLPVLWIEIFVTRLQNPVPHSALLC
jgi:hypothetical protein